MLMALAVDYISIGPNEVRDRVAFLMAIPAYYEGFNGSKLDAWTLDLLKGVIQFGLTRAKDSGAYIGAASAAAIVGVFVFCLWLYGLACLLPQRFSKKLGRFATVAFPPSGVWAINWKLQLVALLLGLLGDVPLGWVGDLTLGTNDFLADILAPLPGLLVGGN